MTNTDEKTEKTCRKIKPENLHIQEVFLLSKDEYETHRNNIVPMIDWWLRSPGVGNDQAVCVDYKGNIHCDKHVCNTARLRPALKIQNLLDLNFKIGEVFEMEECTWTVISKDIALCDESIEQAPFDYHYHSSIHEPSNIYKISYARKALKDWARVHGIKCIAERKISPEELEIDKITLLSADEYRRYFNHIEPIDTRWWLRTPCSEGDSHAICIGVKRNIEEEGALVFEHLPVRPSLVVRNIQALNLTVDDSFEMADYTWSVISEEIILCDSAVGKSAYKEDLKDADQYELSDVSKWIDEWAKDHGIYRTKSKTVILSHPISAVDFFISTVVTFTFLIALAFLFGLLPLVIILFGIGTYIVLMLFFFSEQPQETNVVPVQCTETEEANRTDVQFIEKGTAYIESIRDANANITNTIVRKQLGTMETILNNIFEEAGERPSCAKKLDTLISYYLPTIVKLLDVYLDMEQFPTKSEFIKQSQKDIETSLEKYNEAFNALLIELYKEKVADISTDMTTMDNLMLQQGLLPDALELIRRKEVKNKDVYETSSNNAGTSQPDISEENSETTEEIKESGQTPVPSDDTPENKPVAFSLGSMANVSISHGMTTYDSGHCFIGNKRIDYVRSQYCQEQGMFSIGQARSSVIWTRKDDTTN